MSGGKARMDEHADDLQPEYDFSGGVRGKYAERYARGTNVVVLAPDVAKLFPNADAVNEALRALAHIAERHARRSSVAEAKVPAAEPSAAADGEDDAAER